ncbi:hypothetical protein CANTEDRAFT_101041 [Yamadazyma tenuis ATCC 10573]|uniref:Uncharacterized protein n=1 Tax=Candida tenuis (strain ATCC 10573 / BCRC 21748 / CBS 615 / JCM 9827 / NBRC 10315 / NRRL Y-1498 / VKM Y-70) TaxID=590646 RepID=G3AWK8_CANTC|nr:uncharacterized protein CANTEDRAFT_101041 [Yamadazyma tenuis ATCC 10573]EGV66561.1 hypothetical protein CANTEDRAFT_101041 [Yamadazyma tenuis ATCC 10573]
MLKTIGKALNSIKTIDKRFTQLGQTETQIKVEKLIELTKDKAEINELIVKFLKNLDAIGINQKSPRDSTYLRLNYWARMPQLLQLHSVIWDLCRLNDVSQRTHRLNFNTKNIGLLDPKNFPSNYYNKYVKDTKDQESRFRNV